MRYLLILSTLLFTPSLLHAENAPPTGTRINISATAESKIVNDEVVFTFRLEKEGKDADAVRQNVNGISSQIQEHLKQYDSVKLTTLDRKLRPIWQYPKNRPRIRTSWNMSQTEQVVSTNLNDLPTLLDAIEAKGAQISRLQFRINKHSLLKEQEKLNVQAISLFRDKALTIAKGIGGKNFKIIYLNANNHTGQRHEQRFETASMASKSTQHSPPSLSAGEGTVRVTISGEIEVPFIRFSIK